MQYVRQPLMAVIFILLSAFPALAEDQNKLSRQTSDIELLGNFEIVIGDLGDWFDGWDDRETRVYVETYNGYRYQQHYFDSLPAALFVLRKQPGALQIVDLGVPEYSGRRHDYHGHIGHGLIDGMSAYYLWDYDHYSRGGLPLVLAFYDYRDARDALRYRDGEILDLSELIWKLDRWEDRQRHQIYWRGSDRDRWDNDRWDHAWDGRWHDCYYDRNDGWLNVDVNIGHGDRHDRNDRGHGRIDRYEDDYYCTDCSINHAWDYHRDRGYDRDDRHRGGKKDRGRKRDRDRDRDNDRGKDRDRDRDRDRDDDRNKNRGKGTKQTQEK